MDDTQILAERLREITTDGELAELIMLIIDRRESSLIEARARATELLDMAREQAGEHCATCDGTGIGLHGDPDRSRCGTCGGSGTRRAEDAQEWDHEENL